MNKYIYFDNASTTRLDNNVMRKMIKYVGVYGNFSSFTHHIGNEARSLIYSYKTRLAIRFGCSSEEIFFTSGATESNNLAIKGIIGNHSGVNVLSFETEHPSVVQTLKYLEKHINIKVNFMSFNSEGLYNFSFMKQSTYSDTFLIVLMFINNENGIINNINKLGKFCKKRGIHLHVDATQAVGKIKINMNDLYVSTMSFSAHKVHGPKGIGALYVRKGVERLLEPQIHGGLQQSGIRSGTLSTHQIVGLCESFLLADDLLKSNFHKVNLMHSILIDGLSFFSLIKINGGLRFKTPYILSLSFADYGMKNILSYFNNFCLSYGSACSNINISDDNVFSPIKKPVTKSTIRLSLSKYNTIYEVQLFLKQLNRYFK